MKNPNEVARDIINLCDVPENEREQITKAVKILKEISESNWNSPLSDKCLQVFYKTLCKIGENIDL